MTIKKNFEWGTEIPECPPCQMVASDYDMARHLDIKGSSLFVLEGGSLFDALGSPRAPTIGGSARILPIDVIAVVATYLNSQSSFTSVNDVLIRNSWRRGGWLRGPVLVVTNTGMRRGRQIASRAHPNDGHLDVLSVATMNARQRLFGWSKAKLGNHLPHPKILVSRSTHLDLAVSAEQVVVIDGRRLDQVRRITLTIVPDACHVLIASGSIL
ncbi:MAG: hypothetical protein EXQ63_00505 [Ilumatobacteraceae bacterium]|nr:hypothetical protein [Ilumatobacteraceae bacterium]